MEIQSAKLVKVGNSKGIILPKKALEKIGAADELQLEISEHAISIRPRKKNIRAGWSRAFKRMKKTGDDKLIIPSVFNGENIDEWKW